VLADEGFLDFAGALGINFLLATAPTGSARLFPSMSRFFVGRG
jgi:hypothetical protein